MGLACPVCEVPHPDGEHLADHVAITATTRGGDHRAWLDEHAPEWESMSRAELGALLADRAEEVDSIDLHEEVADHAGERTGALAGDRPATDVPADPDNAPSDLADVPADPDNAPSDLDDEARATLAEARAMTERMLADDEDDDGEEGSVNDGDSSDPDDGR